MKKRIPVLEGMANMAVYLLKAIASMEEEMKREIRYDHYQ